MVVVLLLRLRLAADVTRPMVGKIIEVPVPVEIELVVDMEGNEVDGADVPMDAGRYVTGVMALLEENVVGVLVLLVWKVVGATVLLVYKVGVMALLLRKDNVVLMLLAWKVVGATELLA